MEEDVVVHWWNFYQWQTWHFSITPLSAHIHTARLNQRRALWDESSSSRVDGCCWLAGEGDDDGASNLHSILTRKEPVNSSTICKARSVTPFTKYDQVSGDAARVSELQERIVLMRMSLRMFEVFRKRERDRSRTSVCVNNNKRQHWQEQRRSMKQKKREKVKTKNRRKKDAAAEVLFNWRMRLD